MSKPTDLVQGTLDLLILKTIALEPMHGWAIAHRIKQMSKDVLQVQQGSLYPALHKLEQQGWIEAEWGESDNDSAGSHLRGRAGRHPPDVSHPPPPIYRIHLSAISSANNTEWFGAFFS